ncbi:hypothetical protein GF367_02135 [Candidatus Woesearchaeota archaeon]|nr:hypothetical protein [Candidatus Woesearchaeota archaeon]
MSRGQASTEFVILTAFMLVFFIGVTIGIQNQLLSVHQERNEELAAQLVSVINNEAVLAKEVNPGYRRTFYLPAVVDGTNYSLSLSDGLDVFVRYRGGDYLFFLDANVTNVTPLGPGENIIVHP